jgi:hypothetical protein
MPTGRYPVLSRVQKILAREVARERPAVRRPVQDTLAVADRGPEGDELGEVLPPLVAADVEAHPDDAVGAELVGLLLQVIASSRAPYMAWDRTAISWLCFQPAIWMPMW